MENFFHFAFFFASAFATLIIEVCTKLKICDRTTKSWDRCDEILCESGKFMVQAVLGLNLWGSSGQKLKKLCFHAK
jgi:hypothetical protein